MQRKREREKVMTKIILANDLLLLTSKDLNSSSTGNEFLRSENYF